MNTIAKSHRRRSSPAGKPEVKTLQPPQRGQAPGIPGADPRDPGAPREVIEQAHRDISRGLRDTDLHGTPSDVPGPGPSPDETAGAELPAMTDEASEKHDGDKAAHDDRR